MSAPVIEELEDYICGVCYELPHQVYQVSFCYLVKLIYEL